MTSYFRSLSHLPMIYFAHRGYWGKNGFIQNTIPAFEEAIKKKAHFIECDVHCTSDGEIVVHHDPIIYLESGIEVDISKTTKQTLVDLSKEKKIPYSIPLLSELLDLISKEAIGLNIELKGEGVVRPVFDFVSNDYQALHHRLLISSFSDKQLRAYRALDDTIDIGILRQGISKDLQTIQEWTELLRLIDEVNPVTISVDDCPPEGIRLSQGTIERLCAFRDKGVLGVGVYTVNKKERLDELVREGVAFIFSDQTLI